MSSSSLALPLSLSLPSTPKHSNIIRNNRRIRRRPVVFGNPALGTYEGVVFTMEDGLNEAMDDLFLPVDLTPSSFSLDCVAAMINVPPEQVPEGVLHLARSHQSQIKHARIVISSFSHDNDEDLANSDTTTETTFLLDGKSKSPLPKAKGTWTTSPITRSKSECTEIQQSPSLTRNCRRSSSSEDLIMPSPNASAVQSAAAIFASDPSSQLRTPEHLSSLNPLSRGTKTNAMNHETIQHRTYLVLFVLSSARATRQFVSDLNNKPYTILDETQIAQVEHVVRLEAGDQNDAISLLSPAFGLSAESSANPSKALPSTSQEFASPLREGCCHDENYSLSREPASSATTEVHNCAVCLESLDQGSDNPDVLITTVCNHSFHWACLWRCKDSPCPVCRYDHAGLNEKLSQCHICGTTEQNYVCLICGIISCTSSSIASHDGTDNTTSLGHAQQHYDETLHAYALDTETQHVWDFCGQGYVHRLLQNASDGKLVEVSHQAFNQRLPEAGRLSDAQEDELVHRKLEGFAQQYYALLKSQLEEQRAYYEGQLEELLRGTQESRFNSSRSNSSSEALIAALKQERRQLHHRLTTLKDRYQKLADEVSFLKNLNESLETNKEQMRRQVQEAQRERSEAREMIQQALPPLELKVQTLISRLEQQEGDDYSDSKVAAG